MNCSAGAACLLWALALTSLHAQASAASSQGGGERPPRQPWIETLSWSPRAFLYRGFLTPEECDYLIELARPRVERSTVVSKTGRGAVMDIRTSEGTFIRRGSDEVVSSIGRRVAEWTHLPEENAEDLQILRYQEGQQYGFHYDLDPSPQARQRMEARGVTGGPRTATVLMYLSDVEEGGETAFPQGTWLNDTLQRQGRYSECAARGIAVRPRKGDAILFWSLQPGGQRLDRASLHAGCPVISGEKWSATTWIRVERFGRRRPQPPGGSAGGQGAWQEQGQRRQQPGWLQQQGQGGGPGGARQAAAGGAGRGPGQLGLGPGGGCQDLHVHCEEWAASGECARNPGYMVGGAGRPGQCRVACGACRSSPGGSGRGVE